MTMIHDMNYRNGEADCVLLMLCKMKPFIWGMQKAINDKIIGGSDDEVPAGKQQQQQSDWRNVFFRFLPSFEEFKNNGSECEASYKACKLF